MVEVRITYASRVFSFPDRAVSVEDIADIMQNSSGGRSVSFSDLQFPADVAELVAAGHDFARATGEVLVNDVVVLSGSVSEPQYGRAGDPVSLTVSDEPYNDRGAVPSLPVPVPASASYIVDNTGAYVPFVFGQPCVYTDENGEDHAGIGWPVPVTKRAIVGKAIQELAVFSHTVPAATTATFF